MLDQENTTAIVDTDNTENNQATKTFTQDEVNAILAKTKSQLEKKITSKYADLGDPDELRGIVDNYKKQQQEVALKRGEFDKVMSELASKKDAEIQKRDAIIREFKIEQPLMALSAQHRSVNPAQVTTLLKPALRLNEDGEVEVIDTKTGSVRYDDNGAPLSVEKYVKEFLDANPHFTSATPATTNSQTNVNKVGGDGSLDLSKLDLTRADHRKIYAEARRQGKI
jgi:hypothetical protein